MYAEVYSGQVLDKEDTDKLRDDEGDRDVNDVNDNWFSGKLKFRKHVDDAYRSGDGRQAHDYEVIDPRIQSYGGGGAHQNSSRGGSGGSERRL